ncbi:hypothetical protein [Sorangium sp. So ce388]|uniref:hypothetical protein n=1 Tax=Sorangium sp. So ce388 TaxID=3133309 RepID=UPI003F5B2470
MIPGRLGVPCWDGKRVEDVITNIAKMDASRAHHFLATHSPIRGIVDERRSVELTEEELFQQITADGRKETLVAIYGEPGTGKSHLIHWLKLRLEQALRGADLVELTPLIIQRRTGSLKDALDQMLGQLPPEFSHYLEPVRRAVGKLSDDTARETLVGQLFLELGDRWKARGRKPLPRNLANARELCASQGYREWLCRKGGVIDANIKRLTQASDVEDRTALPMFTATEFRISARYRQNNSPAVLTLIDEIEEYSDTTAQLAEIFNAALPFAIKEMSGLGDETLPDIFENIRRDLHARGSGLALFIEDVSVMSELDHDVLRAIEPRSRPELGRLVAVVGMTHTGRERLRQNELERVTHLVSVSEAVRTWRGSPDDVARFAARYLNVVRLPDEQVREIAHHRRRGSDVHVSRCSGCPVEKPCHRVFGKIDFDGVPVGLFPLTPRAGHTLLAGLDERSSALRQNPRGFLDHVLRPLLVGAGDLEAGRFPRPTSLPVRLPEPANWAAFEARYCGGWDGEQRARLKLLAQGWVESGTIDEMAAQLAAFIEPLEFPKFTRATRDVLHPKPAGPPAKGVEPPVQVAREKGSAVPRPLQTILDDLAGWYERKEELTRDERPRELILDLLRRSFPIEDTADLPRSAFDRFFEDKGAVRIDGQRSNPATRKTFFDMPRDEETRALIEALARFEFLGGKSWSFDNAELHKRVVSRWLRRHRARIAAACQPEGLDVRRPVTVAAQILAFGAVVRRHARLPMDAHADLVREVIADLGPQPTALTDRGSWAQLLAELTRVHAKLKEFVLDEVHVSQGKTGGINFIDPRPLIEGAAAFAEQGRVEPLDPAYQRGFWQSRYDALTKSSAFADLATALEPERAALRATTKALRAQLDDAGYAELGTAEALPQFCADLLDLSRRLRKNKMPVPDEEFEKNAKAYADVTAWGTAAATAEGVVETPGVEAMLCFDPVRLTRVRDGMNIAERYIARVEKEILMMEKVVTADGDPDELARAVLGRLEAIEGFGAGGEA